MKIKNLVFVCNYAASVFQGLRCLFSGVFSSSFDFSANVMTSFYKDRHCRTYIIDEEQRMSGMPPACADVPCHFILLLALYLACNLDL